MTLGALEYKRHAQRPILGTHSLASPRSTVSIQVPEQELLSEEYAALRFALIDTDEVLGALLPGDPRAMLAEMPLEDTFGGREWGHGTVHVDVINPKGNMVAATPSGAWIKSSEVVANLGFPLGTRLMTFYLGPEHHPKLRLTSAPARQSAILSPRSKNNHGWCSVAWEVTSRTSGSCSSF
jgi:gamma-glutamyltranspeptidase